MSRQNHYNINHHKDNSSSDMSLEKSFLHKLMFNSSIGMIAFLVAFISFSALSPIEPTNAEEILFANQATGGAVSLTTSGNVNLSMQTSASGSVRTALDTVSVTAGDTGYQLYISATGNTNALIRDGATSTGTDAATGAPTYADDDVIPTLASSNNLVPITAPTNLQNNTWGFAVPSKNSTSGSGSEDVVTNGFDASYPVGDNSSASSKFASIPTRGNDILIAKRSAPANNVPTNFYYGVKATSSKPSGLFTNTITYTAIGDSNASGLASITPERTNQLAGGQILNIATSSTLALSSITNVNVTIGGQTCANATAAKNGSLVNITCASPALATGWHEVIATITTASDTTETYIVNPSIEYYADEATIAGTMQDFDIIQCGNMVTNQTAILRDTRDGKTYSIAKMADGNCWMTQNLRLGTPGQSITLTSADSDVTSNYTINSSEIQTTDGVNWTNDYNITHIYSFTENTNVSNNNKIAYGNLYNWYTATASTGTQNGVTGGIDAPSSICPKGWKLPSNTGNGSYTVLMQSLFSSIIPRGTESATYIKQFQQAPLNLVLSGQYYSSIVDQEVYGSYWSRTSSANDNYAMFFYFNAPYIEYNFHNDFKKSSGYAVRCVLPATMQDVTNTTVANATEGVTTTLKDYRDGQDYTVAKINGNLWMTQNLRIIGSTALGDPTGTISTAGSNFTGSSITFDGDLTLGNDYTKAYYHDSGNTTNGVWYNYSAATAKTVVGDSNSTNATQDICPSNWRLPTSGDNSEQSGITDFKNAYNPITGGHYAGGTLNGTGYGYWWSTTANNTTTRYRLSYNGSNLNATNNSARYDGLFIRCISPSTS